MAARRLLIVMLILLAISTIASVFVPTRDTDEGEGTTATRTTGTETTPTEAASPATPELEPVEAKVAIGSPKLPVVPLAVGQRLTLRVSSPEPGLVEIEDLGYLEAVAPGTPATFYLLGEEPRSYGVTLVESGAVVARIDVRDASRKPPAPGGSG